MMRLNAQGFIEVIDLTTGRVLCVQRDPCSDFLEQKFDNLTEIDTPQGKVWIEKGIDPTKVLIRSEPAYSIGWADLIAEHLLAGKTLQKACEALQIKYSTISRWRREHQDFAKALAEARKDRAELLGDKALEIADATTQRTVSQDRLKIDTLQWEAERAAPEKYASKAKADAPTVPTIIVIDTGIRRPKDEGYAPPDFEIPAQPLREAFESEAGRVREIEAPKDFGQFASLGREEDGRGSKEALTEVADLRPQVGSVEK